MKAIITKYLGPTDHRDARIKAVTDGGTVTLSYDHAHDGYENHMLAATALAGNLGWLTKYRLEGGGLPPQTDFAYCFVLIADHTSVLEGHPDLFIERVLHAAERHGELSEPDHEVGDLQGVIYALWKLLTPEQRAAYASDEEANNLIITWVDE